MSHSLSLCTLASVTASSGVVSASCNSPLSHSPIRAIWVANGGELAAEIGVGVRDGFFRRSGLEGKVLTACLLEAGFDWGFGDF